MKNTEAISQSSRFGLQLSIIEVGLGSLLHGLRIPFSGVFLSLNQGFILCRYVKIYRHQFGKTWMPYGISNIAAVLKTLSPAGKKFGPMLSLSMQGFLFNLGIIVGGKKLAGMMLGMALLSLWAFVQPIITYTLFFGTELFGALDYFYQKTLPYHFISKDDLFVLAMSLVFLKIIMGLILAVVADRSSSESIYSSEKMAKFDKLYHVGQLALKNNNQSENHFQSRWYLALKDLMNPLFIVSFLLTTLFLFITKPNDVALAWMVLRPLAVGYLFFYFSRSLTLERWLKNREKGALADFAQSSRIALDKMLEMRKKGR